MCELCAVNEPKMLDETLKQFLRPGVRIAVKYSLTESDCDEVVLIDEEGLAVTISTVADLCWETERRDNVVKFPG